jgi:hypothetical protein
MAYILAALFDDKPTAERAAGQLASAGFIPENIHVWDREDRPDMLRQGADAPDGDTMLGSLRSFFRDIFGEEHYSRHAYSDALERGEILLLYSAETERDIDNAAEIVETFHPLTLDTPGGWRDAGGLRHGTSAASGSIPSRRG